MEHQTNFEFFNPFSPFFLPSTTMTIPRLISYDRILLKQFGIITAYLLII